MINTKYSEVFWTMMDPVPLDQEIDMVYAFLSFSADWREHNKKGNWSMKVHKGLGNDKGIAEPINLFDNE